MLHCLQLPRVSHGSFFRVTFFSVTRSAVGHFTSPQSVITTLALVFPLPEPTFSIALTTSIPSTTVPNTTCLPSSHGVGTVQTPPSIGKFNLPNLGKRNWLKLAPKVRMRGNSIEITLEYMLSGPLGWFTEIYSVAQLGESGGNNGGS